MFRKLELLEYVFPYVDDPLYTFTGVVMIKNGILFYKRDREKAKARE